MKNIEKLAFKKRIFETYLSSCELILVELTSSIFLNSFDINFPNKRFFFINSSARHFNYKWGTIELNQIQDDWALLKNEILYLIPTIPSFRKKILQERNYINPLYKYKKFSEESYKWTLEFAKLVDSWLIAAVMYDIGLFSKQERLEIITKIVEVSTIFETCSRQKLSNNNYKNERKNRFHSFLTSRQAIANRLESFNNSSSLSIDEVYTNHMKRYDKLIKALRSLELWNICNTYERGQYLFLMTFTDTQQPDWSLIDIEDESINQEITEVLPGLIEVPYPPAFKFMDFPSVGYQPTPEERYKWTLELARRLDAWLAAIISYSASSFSQKDKLKIYGAANNVTLFDICCTWKFAQEECYLNWLD